LLRGQAPRNDGKKTACNDEEQLAETDEQRAARVEWINTESCGQQWDAYLAAINAATSVEEVEAINIEFKDE
jgi:hypothetical protein